MRCFVCGAKVEEGADCAECGTAAALQNRLVTQTARSRFLFGRIRPDEIELQRQPPPTPRREARGRRAPKPKPAAPGVQARDFSTPAPADPDLIRARDREPVELEPPQAPPAELAGRLLPHTLDVLTCVVLNLLVLQVVLSMSGRSFQPLVVYSLVPLFFVLFGFTALYFGLFALVLGKSLGRLLYETWWQEA